MSSSGRLLSGCDRYSRVAVAAFSVVVLACAGCNQTERTAIHAPDTVPAVHIDADASELVSMNSNDAVALKPVVSEAIASTVSARTGLPKPARFRAVITGKAERNTSALLTCSLPWALPILSIPLSLYGCPSNLWSADVALTLETAEGAILQGDGHGEVTLDNAANNPTLAGEAWQNAVFNAVQDAMIHLHTRTGKVAAR